MKIISRKDAKAAGLKRYFTGKACPHGHVAERSVSGKTCIECGVASQQTPAHREYQREYAKTPAQRKRRRTYMGLYARTPTRRRAMRERCKTPAYREWRSEYRSERYANDPLYNAKHKLRASFRAAVRRGLVSGHVRGFEKRFGYTMVQFKAHFEKQFTQAMTWQRFTAGEIEIDHIRPVANFPTPLNVKEVWALSNLQPLWKHVHAGKSDHYPNYPANVFYVHGQSVQRQNQGSSDDPASFCFGLFLGNKAEGQTLTH